MRPYRVQKIIKGHKDDKKNKCLFYCIIEMESFIIIFFLHKYIYLSYAIIYLSYVTWCLSLHVFGRDKGACAPIRVRAQCALKRGAPLNGGIGYFMPIDFTNCTQLFALDIEKFISSLLMWPGSKKTWVQPKVSENCSNWTKMKWNVLKS